MSFGEKVDNPYWRWLSNEARARHGRQAFRTQDNAYLKARALELLVDKKLISIDMLIQGFITSNSYKEANMRSELLTEVTTSFSPEQINILADATIKNSQINEAWDAKKRLRQIFSKHRNVIKPEFLDKLRSLNLIES